MNIAKLRELAKEAREHPNYQHKGMLEEELNKRALQSFKRLPEQQQLMVSKSWAGVLSNSEPAEELTLDKGNEMMLFRFLAQTNLFFLCHLLETYNQTTIHTHEDICNKFFVSKDPTFKTFRSFALQYTDLKQRMLLVPRGGFKSSCDIADCVQWVISYPEVTILILTGVMQLAKDFVKELRAHFEMEENQGPDSNQVKYRPRHIMDKATGDWSPSLFQSLFPEHCIVADDGTKLEYQTPAASVDKEPTVRAASIEQSLAGPHYGVMKLDDVITNENSQTTTRLEAVNKQIDINKGMLHPYGFLDLIGTWYDEHDYYGKKLKQEIDFATEEGLQENINGSIDEGRFDSHVFLKTYLRACWWPTEEAKKAGKIPEEMKKGDYVLWFPEQLSYEYLREKQKTEADTFPIKYLNNPRQLSKVKFPRELLMRRTIPHNQLPPQGVIVTTVDTAYSTKSWADFTVILTSIIYGGRFYIINMVRGRYNEYDLPKVIAATAHKWKPKRIAIEDSVGVKWMGQELKREMNKLQISVPVEYVSLGLGSKAKAKSMKAKPVLRLLGDERMLFSNSCEGLEEIYSELEQFTGTSDDAHDDIVSALSLLADQFQSYADMGSRLEGVNVQYASDQQATEIHNLVHCLGKYAHLNSENRLVDDNPVTAYEMENNPQIASSGYHDPFADLMG